MSWTSLCGFKSTGYGTPTHLVFSFALLLKNLAFMVTREPPLLLDLCSNSISPHQWWGSSSFSWGAFCSLIGVCSLSRLTVGRDTGSFLSGSFSNQLSQSNLDDDAAIALTHVALEFPRIPWSFSCSFPPLSFTAMVYCGCLISFLCLHNSCDLQCRSLSGL